MAEPSAKPGKRQGFTPSGGGAWKPHSARAKPVGEFVPALMKPAFEKYGFPAAAILTDWAAIAGNELAAFTAPERLKWPRKSSSGTDEGGQGATLILRVDGPRALEVEHMRPRLIERINASFGYRAVADIRVLQAPLLRREVPKPRPNTPQPASTAIFADLKEDRVREALARIAAAIEAARQKSAPASPRL